MLYTSRYHLLSAHLSLIYTVCLFIYFGVFFLLFVCLVFCIILLFSMIHTFILSFTIHLVEQCLLNTTVAVFISGQSHGSSMYFSLWFFANRAGSRTHEQLSSDLPLELSGDLPTVCGSIYQPSSCRGRLEPS